MKHNRILPGIKKQLFNYSTVCFLLLMFGLLIPLFSMASGGNPPSIGRIRVEFILFAFTLIGVAVFHHKTFQVALTGLTVILIFKFIFDSHFNVSEHFLGSTDLLTQIIHKDMRQGEWAILLNLLGLLLGFAILAKHFEESGVPGYLPKWLPDSDHPGLFVSPAPSSLLS